MADITIDNDTYDFLGELAQPRSLVWTTKDIGYVFFIDSDFDLNYRKTTNGGTNWGSRVAINGTTDTAKFAIWYDKWTSGDSGTIIHIAYIGDVTNIFEYKDLNTSSDSLGSAVDITSGINVDFGDWNATSISLVKSRGGNIYAGGWTDSVGETGFFRATQSPATSFSSRANVVDGNDIDRIMFLTGKETDNNDIWCIYQDTSSNLITLKVYDNSANSWSESSSIDGINEDTSFFQFDCMDRHSDGHGILIMWTGRTGTSDFVLHDITNITTFTQKTDIITNDATYGSCAILINQNNNDIYAAYSTGTTGAAIKYKKSTDGGANWGSETALSVSSDNHQAIYGGTSIKSGDTGRWMPVWFNEELVIILTNKDNSVELVVSAGTNLQLNINDAWKTVDGVQINIGDAWKTVGGMQINIGDAWKTIF